MLLNPRTWFRQKPIEKRATPSSGLGTPAQWLVDLLTGTKVAGVNVSDETALTNAAVLACNRILCETVACMPIGLYKRMPNGDIKPQTKEQEHKVVSRNPCPLYTSYTLRSTLQLSLGLRGNAYARIFRDGKSRVNQLRFLHPSWVMPFFMNDELFYQISPNPYLGYSKAEVIGQEDMLHIIGLSSEGVIGKSPVTLLRETIGLGLATRQYAVKTLENGGILRGLLKHPGKLNQGQVDGLRENFKEPIKNGEFPVLENGVEFQAITLTPADSEFINTSKLTTSDIARAYRVPPHMIGDQERATFSNIEQQSLEFLRYTLTPWIANWEQELNRKVIPIPMQDDFFFSFDLESLLASDAKSQGEFLSKMFCIGVYSQNDIRKKLKQNRIKNGDTYFVPTNLQNDALAAKEEPQDDTNTDNGNEQQPGAGKPAMQN